ncbi:anti-sigma F factor [Anaeroselena agilis]|uniref:Anti-sigma F factor n=1 Tax=Anaeroselena agilis TaxID=3063788 RepID=A0ABU3NWA2_9FIRM|nr:anti-sigma F factor [Selenomonadales bacterium 4137-cl]
MASKNEIRMSFPSNSENVGIARITAAAFASQLDLTISDIEEIKVAVSEAITNAVIHGYGAGEGEIEFTLMLDGDRLEFVVADHGKGIADIEQARQPSFSTDPDRMGLGFVFMESFMDEVVVESAVGTGTTVRMVKRLAAQPAH